MKKRLLAKHSPVANEAETMRDTVIDALEDAKGVDIQVLAVSSLTDITDYMIIVSGSSDRHLKTLSERVIDFMLVKNWRPLGVEGEQGTQWILVDFVDVVVHLMRPSTRQYYDLESLWDPSLISDSSLQN